MRVVRLLLVLAVVGGLLACSNKKAAGPKKRLLKAEASFGTLPGNPDPRNICGAYAVKDIKDLLGGGKQFRQFAPEKLKNRGGPGSAGVECRWQRGGPGKDDEVTLRVDAIDYKKASAGTLDAAWSGAKAALRKVERVPNLGDDAVSGTINGGNTVTARKGSWMITVSSAATGKAEATMTTVLTLVAARAVARV